jgi:hypothetical protein
MFNMKIILVIGKNEHMLLTLIKREIFGCFSSENREFPSSVTEKFYQLLLEETTENWNFLFSLVCRLLVLDL